MPREINPVAKRPRVSIDVYPETRRRLRLAAARRNVTVRQYLLTAIEDQLKDDLGDNEGGGLLALSAQTDPVLADLWDNEKDAAYDQLKPW